MFQNLLLSSTLLSTLLSCIVLAHSTIFALASPHKQYAFQHFNFSVHLDHHHHHRFRLGEFVIVFRSYIKLQRSTKMFKQELQVFFALACVFV